MHGGGFRQKLTSEQMEQLKGDVSKGSWTTDDVRKHIKLRFNVDYSMRQVSRMLKKFKMHYTKPYPHDYRRPKDAEDQLKKLAPDILKDEVIGFMDQSSPQTTANTVRMWSFSKPTTFKDTKKYKSKTFGFYTVRGNAVIDFPEH